MDRIDGIYLPLDMRRPDSQYKSRLAQILDEGVAIKETPQGVGARMCFGDLAPMVFDIENGVPLVTERKIGFWKKGVSEILAFINGARTTDELEAYGCNFWKDYAGRGVEFGMEPNDLGPGSYGAAFHDFEIPGGGALNQFEQVVEQITKYPSARTHLVTPWKPYYTARGPRRKVIVAPCHGWLHFRVVDGKLLMRMDQRSADMPVGVPSNMIQYSALLLMMAQVTGLRPWKYIHSFSDAHIYEDQVEKTRELVQRESGKLPILRLDPSIKNLFDFRIEHFTLEEYDAGTPMAIPYRP